MEKTKFYYKGEEVEVIDLLEHENGRLVAYIEYLDEDMDDGIYTCYFDKLEQKIIK